MLDAVFLHARVYTPPPSSISFLRFRRMISRRRLPLLIFDDFVISRHVFFRC